MKNYFLKLMLILGATIGLLSCNDDDHYYYYYPSDAAHGLLINASPNSGDLFVFADENQVNENSLNYTNVKGYYKFYTGERQFFLQNQNGDVLASYITNLEYGDYFSVFATGTFDNISLNIYPDNVDYPGINHSMLRFINLGPDAPEIDLYMDGELIAEAVEFTEATSFFSIDKGSYDIIITEHITGNVLYENNDIDLYGGRAYTMYTKGFVTPPSGSNDVFSSELIVNY